MKPLLTIAAESATKKRPKINRTCLQISQKIVAFQELTSLKHVKKSKREVADLLEVPNSTMQSWQTNFRSKSVVPELADFFSTPSGAALLHRLVMAAYQVIHFGCGGIRGLQEFLQLSTLSCFVASSDGALQAFSVRCEEHIVAIGESEEKRLAAKMKKRKVTAALDEMFRGRHPCLVAIEVVSNYVLLEKFTDDRKAETWSKELKPRLDELNLDLHQVVSDLGGGICSCTKELGAQHISELFHAQHELTKATAAPLAAQQRECDNNLNEAEAKLNKIIERHGQDSEKAVTATMTRNLSKYGYDKRKERRKKVSEAKKELSRIHHPIDINTGKLQTAEIIKNRFDNELSAIESCANEAELSTSCQKRLAKARKTFDSIVGYVTYFFVLYAALVKELEFEEELEKFFNEVIFPLSYLTMIWRRLQKKQKEELKFLREGLERRLQDAVYSEELKSFWMKKGREYAELFQRSSSCVEGRNGMLSLYYHRFHRLNIRSLKALTVVHNFHTRRTDDTTAAERLFGCKHENLFDSLAANVRIPGRPQQQHHDIKRRQMGWQKRLAAQDSRRAA